MTEEEIKARLRPHGVDDLSDISRAYREPNGMISIIRRAAERPMSRLAQGPLRRWAFRRGRSLSSPMTLVWRCST
ncbi:YetF domain-containing protein [Streptomyces griseoflavus]|uniref:YetF domain-containing protein n=1 Tax=Streptomyces griseoflavus TaxID=35619 RepID=UPI0037F6D71E